jgi:hypothetical protein
LFIQHVVSSRIKGHLVLPGTLLGLPKDTSSAARHADETLKNRQMRGGSGRLKGVVAAVYGSPSGHLVALTGGGLCGTCMPNPASQLKSDLIAQGYPDARLFPAGLLGLAAVLGRGCTCCRTSRFVSPTVCRGCPDRGVDPGRGAFLLRKFGISNPHICVLGPRAPGIHCRATG